MTIRPSVTNLTSVIIVAIFLSACGGGSDGEAAATSSSAGMTGADIAQPTTPPSAALPNGTQAAGTPVAMSSIKNANHADAALAGSNVISLERQGCGLGGLQYDEALAAISNKHAQYNQYVFSHASLLGVNEHNEDTLTGYEHITGARNPFFSGRTFADRIDAAQYSNQSYTAAENIARKTYFATDGMILDPVTSSVHMARTLLAAPYHLKQLVNPVMTKTGSALVAHTPYNTNPDTNKGYIFVNTSASPNNTAYTAEKGIFTYPCEGTSGTNTALYNESPNPVKGTGRDLRINPIGQPIYVSMPSAKTIKVSQVKVYDAARQLSVPIDLLDRDRDPYAGTNYQIAANEAFILPLPDNFKTCEQGSIRQGKECGLHGNTTYQVSFDVLVDNKDTISKSFHFTTGDVNY